MGRKYMVETFEVSAENRRGIDDKKEMLATGTYTVIPRRKIGSCETVPAGAVVLELPVMAGKLLVI